MSDNLERQWEMNTTVNPINVKHLSVNHSNELPIHSNRFERLDREDQDKMQLITELQLLCNDCGIQIEQGTKCDKCLERFKPKTYTKCICGDLTFDSICPNCETWFDDIRPPKKSEQKLGRRKYETKLLKDYQHYLNFARSHSKGNFDVYWMVNGKIVDKFTDLVELYMTGVAKSHITCHRMRGGMLKTNVTSIKKKDGTDYMLKMKEDIDEKPKQRSKAQIKEKQRRKNKANKKQKWNDIDDSNSTSSLDINRSLLTPNGAYYNSSRPMYKGDPAWHENSKSTPFEDQVQFMRYCLASCQLANMSIDPTTWRLGFYDGIPLVANICTEWTDKAAIYYPELQQYDHRFDVYMQWDDDSIHMTYPNWGSHKTTSFPLDCRPNGNRYLIFREYTRSNFNVGPFEQYTEVKFQRKMSVMVPKYLIHRATLLLSGKNVTSFGLTKYMDDMYSWYDKTAMAFYHKDLPSKKELIATYFHVCREKQMILGEKIGVEWDVLLKQHHNMDVLTNLPKYSSFWNVVSRIAEFFVPQDFRADVKEFFRTAHHTGLPWLAKKLKNIAYTGTGILYLLWLWFRSKLPNGFHAFKSLHPVTSAVVEELIHLLPFGGTGMAIYEGIQDVKNGEDLSTIMMKWALHITADLVTTPIKLMLFPFRLAGHVAWNWYNNPKRGFNHVRELFALNKKPYVYEDNQVPSGHIVNKEYRDLYATSTDIPQPEGAPNLESLKLDDTIDTNPVYITMNLECSNTACSKNGNNISNAIYKRNLQEYPLDKISDTTKKQIKLWSQHVIKMLPEPETKGDIELDWINLDNHGSKKAMYMKAREERDKSGEIIYSSSISQKRDEVTFQPSARSITAYHNSYVVTVAPYIHKISKSMSTLFDGKTNVSKNPLFKLYVKYASNSIDEELTLVIKYHKEANESDSYLLCVLGDDTKLLMQFGKTANCDFKRYDSTQHSEWHQAYRDIYTNFGWQEIREHLEKAYDTPTKLYIGEESYTIPCKGLKTGCPETSTSNTFITTIGTLMAIDGWYVSKSRKTLPDYIEDFYRTKCGWLPKMNTGCLQFGSEFLKHIFIEQGDQIVVVPLLSTMAKIGKFNTNPYNFVPNARIKSYPQVCVDATYMQIKGKGNWDRIPGFKILFDHFTRMVSIDTLGKYIRDPYKVELKIETEVEWNTIASAYNNRYWIDVDDWLYPFKALTKYKLEQFPFVYNYDTWSQAVASDYGVEL